MTTKAPETTPKAVERLANRLEREATYDGHGNWKIAAVLRAVVAERDALREVLLRWQSYGCPDCGGDCGSANPPVSCCIMQETRAALTKQEPKE